MAAEGGSVDALSQFELTTVLGPVGASVGFTQANAWMVLAAVLITLLIVVGMRARSIVPGRLQALAEISYEGVMFMSEEQMGQEGRRYFPFIFTLFFFILFGNTMGLLPYAFTFTSHIAITVALAIVVVVLSTIVGLMTHGWHFFSYFFPKGAPVVLAPLIVPIEVISYLSRIVSLSVRLFANMVAGHVMLKVFATFVVMLGGAGIIGLLGAVAPLAINVALLAFELLVAFLQAYVFAILACIYLHDALYLH